MYEVHSFQIRSEKRFDAKLMRSRKSIEEMTREDEAIDSYFTGDNALRLNQRRHQVRDSPMKTKSFVYSNNKAFINGVLEHKY